LLLLHRSPPTYRSYRRVTFKTFGWSATKAAVAGANAANAASSSATQAIHMDTLRVSVISSGGAMTIGVVTTAVVSASALPASAWELVPTATEQTDEKDVNKRPRSNPRLFLRRNFNGADHSRSRVRSFVRRKTLPFRRQPPGFRFRNYGRPVRKNPCFREHKPWRPQRISGHGWNRTRSGNRPRRGGYLAGCAAARPRF